MTSGVLGGRCRAVGLALAWAFAGALGCSPAPAGDGDSVTGGAGGAPSTAGGGGSSGAPGGDLPLPPPADVELHGACEVEQRVGGFVLMIDQPGARSSLDGVVKNGADPAGIPELLSEAGDCRLQRRRHLSCDPICPSGQTCGVDETCVPMPRGQSLETVLVAGLTGGSSRLEPVQPGFKYFDTTLPHPPCAPGDVVRLRTTEGFVGPAELYGLGVEPLVLTTPTWLLERDTALTITWEPGTADARVGITAELSVDQHGATPVRLVCDPPDSGELVVEATVVNAILDAGVSGFPNGRIARRTLDSVRGDFGCVDFVVSSPVTPAVRVAGFTPCTTQDDCPSGLVCNTTLNQCE